MSAVSYMPILTVYIVICDPMKLWAYENIPKIFVAGNWKVAGI